MPNLTYKLHGRNSGFTIVELLIVVVVIAILAAIVVVSYNGIRERAITSVLQADISTAAKLLELDKIADSNSHYPASLALARGGQGIKVGSESTLEYTYNSGANTYCISITSSRSNTAGYHIASPSMAVLEGVCDGHVPPGGVVAKVWTKISTGSEFACGIANGEAYCWGANQYGQLGNGTTTESHAPVKVKQAAGLLAGKTVTQISAGGSHTCAVADGIAYCWGYGQSGRMGDNGVSNRTEPVEVAQVSGFLLGKTVTRISAGGSQTCAIASGELYCWGTNSNGQIGDGTTTQRSAPVKVTQTSGLLLGKTATEVSAAGSNPYACAVASGEAFCWGFNSSGVLGDNSSTQQLVPVKVTQTSGLLLGKTVTDISAGGSNTCAVASGEAFCWGYGGSYQNGNGSSTTSLVPVRVTQASGLLLGKTATNVSTGTNISCGVASGEAFCWGNSVFGALGAGPSVSSAPSPVKVTASAGVLAGKTVTALDSASATDFSCVIADGIPYCWGKNGYGQLGNGTITDSNVPVPVTF